MTDRADEQVRIGRYFFRRDTAAPAPCTYCVACTAAAAAAQTAAERVAEALSGAQPPHIEAPVAFFTAGEEYIEELSSVTLIYRRYHLACGQARMQQAAEAWAAHCVAASLTGSRRELQYIKEYNAVHGSDDDRNK